MLFDIYPDLLGEGDQSALFIEQGGRRKVHASFGAVASGEDYTAVVCPLGRCRMRALMRPGSIGSAHMNIGAIWPDPSQRSPEGRQGAATTGKGLGFSIPPDL